MALELQTGVDRPVIKIDGAEYHFATRDDLRYRDIAYMGWAGSRIEELGGQISSPATYSDGAAEEFEQVLAKACKLALYDVPDEVYEKLTDTQRMQIIEVFSKAVSPAEGEEGSRPTQTEQ